MTPPGPLCSAPCEDCHGGRVDVRLPGGFYEPAYELVPCLRCAGSGRTECHACEGLRVDGEVSYTKDAGPVWWREPTAVDAARAGARHLAEMGFAVDITTTDRAAWLTRKGAP